jgi:uncharacterized protein (TIGR00251 family)
MNLNDYVKNGKLHVRVKPSAPKTEILGYDDARNAVKIAVAAPPEDNKANLELLKFVRKQTGKRITLVSGKTSRDKVLEIAP